MKSLGWIRWFIDHTRTVLVLFAFLMISGIIAYLVIPRESTPDIKIPIVIVSAQYPGVSPMDAERLILKPIEQELRSLEGLKRINSTAYEGGGALVVEFFAGLDIDKAKRDVRECVNQARQLLPKDLDDPSVSEVNLGLMPVLVVMLSGEVPDRALYSLADRLKNSIEARVPAVLEAKVRGSRSELVEILLTPQKLEAYNLSLRALGLLISGGNQMLSVGRLQEKSGAFSLRVPGLTETFEDILSLPILADGNTSVSLRDFATVLKGYKDAESLARNKGMKTVSLEISKRLGQNVIHTIEAVRRVVEEERKQWPEEIHVHFAQDDSHRILDMVKDLKNHLISAVFLVMVIIIFTLGLRSALLVGIAIPGSFLTGILMIGLMGFSINIVVLFSLILSIGMLVDGAIIVVEYADRKMLEGMSPQAAYSASAQRMLWPVVTSIFTILVVFLPLMFWPGVVGEFMKYLPYTLVATLTASLLMALVFVPTMGALWGKTSPHHTQMMEMIHISESGDLRKLNGLAGYYYSVLNKALSYPKRVVFFAIGLLIFVIALYAKFGRGVQFFPDVEPKSASVLIHARGSTTLLQKDKIVREVEEKILRMDEFKSIYTTVYQLVSSQALSEDVIGKIDLEFKDWQERRAADLILRDVESKVRGLPGMIVEVVKEGRGPRSGKPIQVNLSGEDFSQMAKVFLKLKDFVAKQEGIKDLEDNFSASSVAWKIEIDRGKAASFGINIQDIGNAIKMVTNGIIISNYHPSDNRSEVDMVLRFEPAYRKLDTLDQLLVETQEGIVPLSMFIKRSEERRLSMIHRTGGERVLTLKADTQLGRQALEVRERIRKWAATNLPSNMEVTFLGEDEDQRETQRFLLGAFLVALFLMTLILLTQFNSFFSAMLILSSIPMSTIGVFIGLLVMGVSFSIVMCGIGIIALAGIIVSNNIILIDTFDKLSLHMEDKREAILRTGVQRLRPVILTKLTAILGLLPIMFRLDIDYMNLTLHFQSPSTLWWQQIAISIVFGVAFASLLTLFVTPCALMWRENYLSKKRL